MPGRGTPLRCIRVAEELWSAFGEAARAAGTDRPALIRAFARWYLGRGELPERPDVAGAP